MSDQQINSSISNQKLCALVSGASSGIGEAVTLRLARQGWTVFAGIRNQTDAERLQQSNPEQIIPTCLDITNAEQIKRTVDQIRIVCGNNGLNALINNAGIAVIGPFEFLKIEDIREQIEVNFLGQIALTQACLQLLRQAGGRIINISSISGRVTTPFFGPYSASKHAFEAFSDALRIELYRTGIKVVLIEPGAIRTPIWEKSIDAGRQRTKEFPEIAHKLYGQDIERMIASAYRTGENGLPASDVADLVWHALTTPKPKSRYLIGSGTRLAVLFDLFVPGKIRDWIVARTTGFDK